MPVCHTCSCMYGTPACGQTLHQQIVLPLPCSLPPTGLACRAAPLPPDHLFFCQTATVVPNASWPSSYLPTTRPPPRINAGAACLPQICQLQRLCFKHWPQLKELALSNCGSVEKRDVLKRHLAELSPDQLRTLACLHLRLVGEEDPWAEDPAFITEVSTPPTRRLATLDGWAMQDGFVSAVFACMAHHT